MEDTPQQTALAAGHDMAASMALLGKTASPALSIMLDPFLFERAKLIATYMSKARGISPPNLLNAPEACFAVVVNALTWKLNPFAVAQCTYATPGGTVGYEGKLVQAILENSGKLVGGVTYQHNGDWGAVLNKFEKKTSQKGNEYVVPTWTDKDAQGLSVTVSAQIEGEPQRREWTMDLVQCHPRNSTLWATDPKTQFCYTAVRRFANVAAPGLLMGVPFDRDEAMAVEMNWGPDHAKDVSPAAPAGERPKAEDFEAPQEPAEVSTFDLVDQFGEVIGTYSAADFAGELLELIQDLASRKAFDELAQLWSSNMATLELLDLEKRRQIEESYAFYSRAGDEPTEFVWTSSNGRVTKFTDIIKWQRSVKAALAKCTLPGQIEVARENNGAHLAEIGGYGGVFAEAVSTIEEAFQAEAKRIGA